MDAEIQVKIRYYSALRLYSNNSMHTDCKKRSLARGCLGIALQMQGNTSQDSRILNYYRNSSFLSVCIPFCNVI